MTAIPASVMFAQFFFGCYVWVQTRSLGAVVWPAIDYDAFRLCFLKHTDIQIIVSLTFSLVFDFLVFVIIIWVGRRSTGFTRSHVPSILDRIVRDATMYFLVIFTSHLIVECFLVFAPKTYNLLPSTSVVIFIPLMATRLMLSLKKAADKSGSFTRTEDLDAVEDVLFAGGYTTMEYAMEAGLSTRYPRDQTADLELVENRT